MIVCIKINRLENDSKYNYSFHSKELSYKRIIWKLSKYCHHECFLPIGGLSFNIESLWQAKKGMIQNKVCLSDYVHTKETKQQANSWHITLCGIQWSSEISMCQIQCNTMDLIEQCVIVRKMNFPRAGCPFIIKHQFTSGLPQYGYGLGISLLE